MPQAPLPSSSLSFSEFMSQSLYGEVASGRSARLDSENSAQSFSESSAPGYYASPSRVGKEGDFYTSVSASRFFGGAVAMYVLKLLDSGRLSTPLRIIEIGADKGYLLGDVAQFLDALSEGLLCSVEFATLEPLGELAVCQREHFASLKLSQEAKFCVYENLTSLCDGAQAGQNAIIISNEIFDSAPCDVLSASESSSDSEPCANSPQMLYIAPKEGRMVPFWGEVSDEVRERLELFGGLCEGYDMSEGAIIPQWEGLLESIRRMAQAHDRTYFLSFDYGGFGLERVLSYNPRFYHAHRVVSLGEILERGEELGGLYQKADITYDVDFALLEALLVRRGFKRVYAKSQARTLVEEMGLLELLEMYEAQRGYGSYLNQIQKVKTLLNTMGGRFMGVCYEFVGSEKMGKKR